MSVSISSVRGTESTDVNQCSLNCVNDVCSLFNMYIFSFNVFANIKCKEEKYEGGRILLRERHLP